MGHSTNSTPSRLRQPELEAEFNRSPLLGYEPTAEVGFIRCLEHGYPTPLARWHCHEEYEFHIITATSGKTFVGDWIGPFEPGHVVLCGTLCDSHTNCLNDGCHLLFIQCPACAAKYDGCCSEACQEEHKLPEEEQRLRRAGRENGNKIFNKSRGRLNTKLGIPDPESAGN